MNEKKLRRIIAAVSDGRVSRRTFMQKMIALGLSAPIAAQMLMQSGVAMAETAFKYAPTKRGGGGALKILYWQGATLLNPHFAVGTKDQDGSRIFYEPLASWDADGNLITKTVGLQAWTWSYDDRNRLVAPTTPTDTWASATG